MSKKTSEIVLTTDQCKQYQKLNKIVEEGMATFVNVGLALKAIQADDLYLAEFNNFSEYCESKLNMSKSQGYRLIDAANTYETVKGVATLDPTSESQIRSLKHLNPDNQKAAWKQAVDSMGDAKKLPAIAVRRVAAKLEPVHFKKLVTKKKSTSSSSAVDTGNDELWDDLEKAIKKLKGRGNARETALKLLKQLRG